MKQVKELIVTQRGGMKRTFRVKDKDKIKHWQKIAAMDTVGVQTTVKEVYE